MDLCLGLGKWYFCHKLLLPNKTNQPQEKSSQGHFELIQKQNKATRTKVKSTLTYYNFLALTSMVDPSIFGYFPRINHKELSRH